MTPEELEAKNRKRRERAAAARQKKEGKGGAAQAADKKVDAPAKKEADGSDAAVEDPPVASDTVEAAVEAAKEAVEKAGAVAVV